MISRWVCNIHCTYTYTCIFSTTNRTEIYVYISVLLVVAEYAGFKMFVCFKALARRSQIDKNAHIGRGKGFWFVTLYNVFG